MEHCQRHFIWRPSLNSKYVEQLDSCHDLLLLLRINNPIHLVANILLALADSGSGILLEQRRL